MTVKYRPSFHRTDGRCALRPDPWTIESHWMLDVVADLEDIELAGLEVSGGTSRFEVRLPRPSKSVRVRIGGGGQRRYAVQADRRARQGAYRRRRVEAGVDDFSVVSAGGKTDWRSPEYDAAEGRYDIEIGAGASKVTVRT